VPDWNVTLTGEHGIFVARGTDAGEVDLSFHAVERHPGWSGALDDGAFPVEAAKQGDEAAVREWLDKQLWWLGRDHA
jgi:hypothetical protein